MTMLRARKGLTLTLALVALALSACDYLRDTEPFTVTLLYQPGPNGSVVVEPATFKADNGFGEIQLVNNTDEKHGFAIKELGVFEEILERKTRTFTVEEARDGRTYTFYCHLHDNELSGNMVVEYLTEEERG